MAELVDVYVPEMEKIGVVLDELSTIRQRRSMRSSLRLKRAPCYANWNRGCLESPCEPSEPLPLGAGHAIRGLTDEPTQHQSAHRQVDHRLTALGEVLILFTQAAVPTNPGDRAFHHSPVWKHGKSRHRWGLHIDRVPAPAPRALHDLQGPAACVLHPGTQALAAIGHIGPDMPQPIEDRVGRGEQPGGRVGIPQIGGVDQDAQQETRRINEEMALAAIEFLRAIIPVGPPFSVVFTVCASIIAAEGCGWRPMRVRTSSRS
jgi:hypothetical protein